MPCLRRLRREKAAVGSKGLQRRHTLLAFAAQLQYDFVLTLLQPLCEHQSGVGNDFQHSVVVGSGFAVQPHIEI